MNFEELYDTSFVQDLIRQIAGDDEVQVIARTACYLIRKQHEDTQIVERVIVLLPHGYTANTPNQMNSHDEAEYVTIEIKGAVREGKRGYSILSDCLRVDLVSDDTAVSELNEPYIQYESTEENPTDFVTEIHAAKEPPFSIVRQDGYGFYHNLVNITNHWLVLKLRKKLRPQKEVNLSPFLQKLNPELQEMAQQFYQAVLVYGDNVFKQAPTLIDEITSQNPNTILPVLGEMLYVYETGNHEACTVFATILKIGKKHPENTTSFLTEALEKQVLPVYYAKQLLEKIAAYKLIYTESMKQIATD